MGNHETQSLSVFVKTHSLSESEASLAVFLQSQLSPEVGPEVEALIALLQSLGVDNTCLLTAIGAYAELRFALPFTDFVESNKSGATTLIHGLSKVNKIDKIGSLQLIDNANHKEKVRKLIINIIDDIRVAIILLAHKIILLRQKHILDPSQLATIAQKTQAIYAPLANILGIGQFKWELEDLSFRVLEPEEYKKIASALSEKRQARQQYIEQIQTALSQALDAQNISNYRIQGRPKHIYSIHKKLVKKNVDFHELFDATAFRIIVNTNDDCYQTLGIIHSMWPYIKEEFDDYVANPKPNGYQSLHTAVVGPKGKEFEIQIRTNEMHQESELGVAAHWSYKEGRRKSSNDDYVQKSLWLSRVLNWHEAIALPSNPTIESERVYVFTPNYDIIDLPKGATILDFAYYIHTTVGHRCIGATVNGRIASLKHCPSTGDVIAINTSKIGQPKTAWLQKNSGYLSTSRARHKVRQWMNEHERARYISLGETSFSDIKKQAPDKTIELPAMAKEYNFKDPEDFLVALGRGLVKKNRILNRLKGIQPQARAEIDGERPHKVPTVSVDDINPVKCSPAKCCAPSADDAIVGYISVSRGIKIHTQDCVNITSGHINPHRLIPLTWNKS